MKEKSYFINYPLFRLAVFMAAGIFFFDRFLPEMSLWPLVSILCVILFPLFLGTVMKFRKEWLNCSFGFFVSVSFFLLGGVLVIQKKGNIEYEWQDKDFCYYGVVETTPEVHGKTLCSEILIKNCIPQGYDTIYSVDRNILLYFIPDSASFIPRCGDEIVFYSSISKPLSDTEFMGFDYSRYLFTKGISGTALAFSGDWSCIKIDNPHSVKHIALRCKEAVVELFKSWKLGDEELAVVSALTIGDKSELTPELKAVYSAAGTSHVLALSGLHVGILSGILYFLLCPLRRVKGGRIFQSLAVVSVLWIFAFISGLSPSVVRAVTMCSLYLVASVFVENGFCGFFSLSFTAFLMLIYNPMYLFDISFQLSFIAVLSIILFYPIISEWVKSDRKPVRYIWNAMSVSLAAQLGTLPLVLYYFGTFPTYFLMANLIVGPLAVAILSFSLLSLLLSSVPVVGDVSVWLLDVVTNILNASMRFVHGIQGAQITSVYFNELQSLLAFILLCILYLYFKKHRPAYIMQVISILCLIFIFEIYKTRQDEGPALFLTRSDLYVRNGKDIDTVNSENGLHEINGIRVGVMKSAYWKNVRLKENTKLATLDYVYICKGFSGNITGLSGLFNIRNVVIDGTLSERYRAFLRNECERLNIRYIEKSSQGSYRILL